MISVYFLLDSDATCEITLDYHPIDKQHPCIRDAANLFLYIF